MDLPPLPDLNKPSGRPQSFTVEPPSQAFSLIRLLVGMYALVTLVLLVRFLHDLFRLFKLLNSSSKQASHGLCYCSHDQELPPFSFFRYLVINSLQYGDGQMAQIIAHEKVHIRQGHTIDLLFAEMVNIVLWPNPLVLALKRAIKLNLEYIVDDQVLKTGIDRKSYQMGILSCLRLRPVPLANLFNSSKIKLRITMMNSKRSPAGHLFKYAFVLPLLATAYFLVNPLRASSLSLNKDMKEGFPAPKTLQAFEGFYQFERNKEAYLQIKASGKGLILKQLWDQKEIHFTQSSELEFLDQDGKFPLKFTKDGDGNIIQVLAFNRDKWNKVKNYKPDQFISLNPEQLNNFAGYYRLENGKAENVYIQIETAGDGLLLRQGWDGAEIHFSARAPLEFLNKERSFPLKFSQDKDGTITKVLAFDKDLWIKVKDPSTVVMKKEISLRPEQLKALEGTYKFQFEAGKDSYIRISAVEKGIVLKQLWDNREFRFVPESPLSFYCKEQGFPLKFTINDAGQATQVLAFNKDLWTRDKGQ
jgi:hypothetical protein